jgi:uncharacterized Tic20 family protein
MAAVTGRRPLEMNESIEMNAGQFESQRPPLETPGQAINPPKGNDKIWSILSHLSAFLGVGILLPLVVWLAMRHESEYVAQNAREALNFHISLYIYSLCCVPLIFILIGIPLLIVLWLGSIVLAIIAAVRASNGECYRYPLILRLVG